MDKIMVSINCLAYNHEKYIARALDSIIMQKVNFKYEILVHDDASDDQTAEIIKGYQAKYPELLNVIYDDENTYTKGTKILDENIDRARGKYIAICEGDDFWSSAHKLQRQFDFLESNPDFSLCVHASHMVNRKEKKLRKTIRPSIGDKVFTIHEIIKTGGRLFATNSMMYRRELGRPLPEFYKISLVEDYPLMVLLALKGNVYYMDAFLSAYQLGLEQSWTNCTYSNIEKTLNHFDHTIKMLDSLNEYSNYTLNDTIEMKKKYVLFNCHLVKKDYRAIKSSEFREIYNELCPCQKAIIEISVKLPKLYRSLQALKRIWKNRYQ